MSDQKLQVLTQHDHILKRPGMYVGGVEPVEYDKEVMTMSGLKRVKEMMTPALLKIIEEPLANASDASQNDPGSKNIKVTTDPRDSSIKIETNTKFKIEYIPEGNDYSVALAFSRFMTGSNFGDDEESFKLGQHGLGIKLTNVFSKYLEVVVHDPSTKQSYHGIWTNNMYTVEKSVVKKSSHKTPYVSITFIPDLPYFGLRGPLTPGQWDLIHSQVFDLAVTAPKHTTVYLNGAKISFKGIKGYVQAIMGDSLEKICMDKVEVNGTLRFEVAVTVARDHAESIVYVNGAHTTRGTIHDYIFKNIASALSKKHNINPSVLKGLLLIVAEAWIPNARFTSQAKEELYTPVSKYGFKWELSKSFIQSLAKTDLYTSVVNLLHDKDDKKAQKDMKVGKNKIPQFAKYDPATKLFKVNDAELLVTEGDSAKQLANVGRNAVKRHANMGLYPLRGKLMNAGNSSLKALAANKEISELIQILGITPYKKYDLASARALPYRHLVLFTDQDVDGSHISGLCIQLIMTLVPSLLEVFPDYIKRFATPILKITSGKHSGRVFYTDAEYRDYTNKHPEAKNASVKYYKGLGTSTDKDAKQYFTEWDKNVITINNNGQPSKDAVKLAFDAKMSAERREYLANQYNPDASIDYSASSTTIERFIYDDLMHFSNSDNLRSIPKMLDGQKAGQRKVVFYALNHVGKTEAKVAQMAGTAAQVTQYHHGEVSLANTIIGMAATYTGSHNLPLLYPSGQFGSRHARNSAAAPRYIFTHISSFLPRLIKSDDNDVLTYNVDENKKVEPTVYIPVIPIVLVNGANGIGTGWKCDVPQYNPLEVIDACKRMASGGELSTAKWVPWYVGYNGRMEETTDGFNSIGTYEVNGNTITITELPIGKATEDWIESIQDLIPDTIKNYEKNLGPDSVTIKLNLTAPIADPVSTLKLSIKIPTNRMWMYNAKNKITHYSGPNQVIQEHARERLRLYEASRISQIEKASHRMDILNNKIRYIMEFIEGKIKIGKMSTTSLNEYLAQSGYARSNNSFRYLTDDISTGQLTTDNVEKLRNQIHTISSDIDALRETTANKMWTTDLNALRKEVDDYIVERLTPLDEDAPKVKKARK